MQFRRGVNESISPRGGREEEEKSLVVVRLREGDLWRRKEQPVTICILSPRISPYLPYLGAVSHHLPQPRRWHRGEREKRQTAIRHLKNPIDRVETRL